MPVFITVVVGLAILFILFGMVGAIARQHRTVNQSRQENFPAVNTLTFDMNYVRQHITKAPEVPFDPTNDEHVAALLMLMNPKTARAHPTLRFAFDSKRYDNAYQAILTEFVLHHTTPNARSKAENLIKHAEKHHILVGLNTEPVRTLTPTKAVTKRRAATKPRKRTPTKSIKAEAAAPTVVSTDTSSSPSEQPPAPRKVLKVVHN